MIKDLTLTLMMGPGVPVPAPRAVLDALQSVTVTAQASDAGSGFELSFSLEKNSPLTTLFVLAGGGAIPFFRVLVSVNVSGRAHPLIDGVATHMQFAPAAGGPAAFSVQGKDMTAAMNVLPFNGLPYPAMPPFARVALILAKYAFLGVIPKVIPSFESVPLPTEGIPRQKGTDLDYVRQLAAEAGYLFRMEPGPAIGTSFAYWGPEIRSGLAQPALTVDSGAADNVESLSFGFDKEGTEIPIVYILTKKMKTAVKVPIPSSIPFLPPMGLVNPVPPRSKLLDNTAHLTPVQALVRGFAHAASHSKAVTGSGTLDVLHYGRVLKAGRPVGVRGAGLPFDGLHFVESVTSTLSRTEFKQNFSLTRNGLLPTQPKVTI